MPGHAPLVLTSQELTGFYWKHLGLPPEGFFRPLQCVVEHPLQMKDGASGQQPGLLASGWDSSEVYSIRSPR